MCIVGPCLRCVSIEIFYLLCHAAKYGRRVISDSSSSSDDDYWISMGMDYYKSTKSKKKHHSFIGK